MILLLLSENMDFGISSLLLLFESQWLKIPPCQNSILLSLILLFSLIHIRREVLAWTPLYSAGIQTEDY